MSYTTSSTPRTMKFSRQGHVEDFLGNVALKRRTASLDSRPVLQLLISTRLMADCDSLLGVIEVISSIDTIQQVRLQILPSGGEFSAEFLAEVFAKLGAKLVSFDSGCSFPGEVYVPIGALQRHCPNFKELNIYAREDQRMAKWIQAMQSLKTLQKIEVGSSEMGVSSVNALVKLLQNRHNQNIEELHIVCSRKVIDLVPLAEGLKTNVGLRFLSVDLSFLRLACPISSAVANQKEIEAFCSALQNENYTLKNIVIGNILSTKIPFYLKLNQLGRDHLLRSGAAQEEDWVSSVVSNTDDPSIVFYLLKRNPAICDLISDEISTPAIRPAKRAKNSTV